MKESAETAVSSGRDRMEAAWCRARSRWLRSGVVLAVLGGMLLGGGIMASVRGAVQPELSPDVIEALKFGDRKDVLLIISVDQDGNMQAFCGLYGGKPCVPGPYEEIAAADLKKEIFGVVSVSNPKVCWKTSSGDKQCVTY